MQLEKVNEIVNNACADYEDGTLGVYSCLELYLEDNDIEKDVEEIYSLYFENQALSCGIPKDVIDGKKNLSDHYSLDYIKYKSNK